jgi:hypothetical protein
MSSITRRWHFFSGERRKTMNKKSVKIAILVLLSLMMAAVIYYSPTLQTSVDTSFNEGRTVSDIYFNGLTSDSMGRLWGIGNNSVIVLEGDSWITYERDSGVPPGFFVSLVSDKKGNIWIGTIESGLLKFDGKNWTIFTTQNSGLAIDRIENLYSDNEGRIWIAYDAAHPFGVTVFDGNTWITYNAANSGLPENYARTIAFDSKNRAWFGTSAGLSVLDGEQWITYTSSNSGLTADNIDNIAFDQDGRAWIGFREGINIFDEKQWKYITSGEMGFNPPGFVVECRIFFDQLGRVWVWDYMGEVRILDKGVWISLLEPDGSKTSSVYSITMDAKGDIYITTGDGLVVTDRDYPIDSEQQSQQLRVFLAHGGILFIEITLAGLILTTLLDSSILALVWVIGNLAVFGFTPVFVLPNEIDSFFIGISVMCATIGTIVGVFVGTRKATRSKSPNRAKFEALAIGLYGGLVVGIFLYYAIPFILFVLWGP